MNIFNLESLAFFEAIGLSQVFKAYANNCSREYIMEIGFNPNTGYVYIALENGIQIACCMGKDVEFIVTDFETGEEYFLETYDEAIRQLEQVN